MYLANDVIQNSKKKGLELKMEFAKVLPRALQHVSREKDESFRKSVERIIAVWEERKVFEPDTIIRFKSMLCKIVCPPPTPNPCYPRQNLLLLHFTISGILDPLRPFQLAL